MKTLPSFALAIVLCLAPFATSLAQDPQSQIDDATVIAAIVPLVAADAEVVRVVGASATLDASSYDGTIDMSGRDDGGLAVQLVFELAGTKARAGIDVVAEQVDGRWEIARLDVSGR